jgi:hypothetical protein
MTIPTLLSTTKRSSTATTTTTPPFTDVHDADHDANHLHTADADAIRPQTIMRFTDLSYSVIDTTHTASTTTDDNAAGGKGGDNDRRKYLIDGVGLEARAGCLMGEWSWVSVLVVGWESFGLWPCIFRK